MEDWPVQPFGFEYSADWIAQAIVAAALLGFLLGAVAVAITAIARAR